MLLCESWNVVSCRLLCSAFQGYTFIPNKCTIIYFYKILKFLLFWQITDLSFRLEHEYVDCHGFWYLDCVEDLKQKFVSSFYSNNQDRQSPNFFESNSVHCVLHPFFLISVLWSSSKLRPFWIEQYWNGYHSSSNKPHDTTTPANRKFFGTQIQKHSSTN